MLRRLGWAILLATVAVLAWVLVSPATKVAASGQLAELSAGKLTSSAVLYRMWRLQLVGTALACTIYSGFVFWLEHAGYARWRKGGAVGAACGGSIALLLFASPPPGAPLLLWAATFYSTGIPVAALLDALPEGLAHWSPISFQGLIALWPIVVTALLVTIGVLVGSVTGEAAFAWWRGAAEQGVEADEA